MVTLNYKNCLKDQIYKYNIYERQFSKGKRKVPQEVSINNTTYEIGNIPPYPRADFQ